jgi:ABC-type phosphate transport system substrate-binding protein
MTDRLPLGRPAVALLASLTVLAASLALAPRAEASFTTGQCAGDSILGRGASFARDAHWSWRFNFESSFCLSTGLPAPTVTYQSQTSGAGIDGMKERLAGGPRFGATDDPPSPAAVGEINEGDPTSEGDDARVHVVPAAVGAVVLLVNFPNDCDIKSLPEASQTAPAAADFTNRIKLTKLQLEQVFAGDPLFDTWGELFPELKALPGGKTTQECLDQPIKRVARSDGSGTTSALKSFLGPVFGADPNPVWPNQELGDPVTGLLPETLVKDTDGSIGYGDLPTARDSGFQITPCTASETVCNRERDDDKFWIPVPIGSSEFVEPTADPDSYKTGLEGAGCNSATFSGQPADTLGDWTSVSGVNSGAGWPICTLIYGLVFDDYQDAYGGLGDLVAEEAQARTVKDHWTSIVSDAGQATLFPSDYSPLPAAILAKSRAGVNAVDWDKASGGGGDGAAGSSGGSGGGGTTPPPPPGDTTPPPATASNVFSVPGTTISSRSGNATLSIRVPGAGVIEVMATANLPRAAARTRIARVRRTVSRAGTYKVTLRPSAAAKKIMRRKGSLRVSMRVTFTPRGGAARSSTRSLTLKLVKRKPRRS